VREADATHAEPPGDADRIFRGIARSYDRVAAILSFGQDPRWRAALVRSVGARPGERVLDVATGTGLVASELVRAYGCEVVGIDQSVDMLGVAAHRGAAIALVRGRAERLPFPDASFDHVTFTYLLRYVDDPRAVVQELARVLRPGGRMATLEFAVPANPLWRALWRLYTRVGLPLGGRIVSSRWAAVGRFLGPNIDAFYGAHPQRAIEGYWREAGFADVTTRTMSLGGGNVMSGTKSAGAIAGAAPPLGAAFYALRPGDWRDYWTLLHPPYTLWHLSYVALGASLVPNPDPRVVAGALAAFALAVGIGAHAFDELRGRPLATQIPSPVLVALGTIALAAAALIGVIGASAVGAPLLAFVIAGVALVIAYGFEIRPVHTDAGFALAWGAFPALTAAYAVGAAPLPAIAVAAAAALFSLAQRELSTRVRSVRRRARTVSGEIRYADGSTEGIDTRAIIAAPEAALRLLWLVAVLIGFGSLAARWLG